MGTSSHSSDFIGRAIAAQGIHELDVCEAIARTVREGDTAIDIGANIGFMTSLLSAKAGRLGRIVAFEPHPELFRRLVNNIDLFKTRARGVITAERLAVSDRDGSDTLVCDNSVFQRNSGTSGLRQHSFAEGKDMVAVKTTRIDTYFPKERIRLLKIDVEGAELIVLKGAKDALSSHRIDFVVYEDFAAAKSGISEFLNKHGYTVFQLDRNIFRPWIREVDDTFKQVQRGRDENFIATWNPRELERIYRDRGWKVFRV